MHQPVMVKEVVTLLGVQPGDVCIDGTLGGGGHAVALMKAAGESGFLLGIDRDEQAVERTRERLNDLGRCRLVKGNYADMREIAESNGMESVDRILLDLGMSSFQVDEAERGFSFMNDGPLDMRMDRAAGLTAADIVNTFPEDELVATIRTLGEERFARKIAGAIVSARTEAPILTTGRLAEVVAGAVGGRRGRIHPATRTFQALRIEVNSEITSLEKGLSAGCDLLAKGGRMAVISFHSIEDRIVKRYFAGQSGAGDNINGPTLERVTRKPVTASAEEISANPRSRSAKLRVVQKAA